MKAEIITYFYNDIICQILNNTENREFNCMDDNCCQKLEQQQNITFNECIDYMKKECIINNITGDTRLNSIYISSVIFLSLSIVYVIFLIITYIYKHRCKKKEDNIILIDNELTNDSVI